MTTKEQEIQQVINEFTMEFCIDMPHPDERLGEIHTVMERSPNEYKDFIKASLERLYEKGREEEKKAWINGERCASCGESMKASDTYDTCPKCWEEE